MNNYLKLIKLFNPKLIIYVNYENDYIINLNNYFNIPYFKDDLKKFNILELKKK